VNHDIYLISLFIFRIAAIWQIRDYINVIFEMGNAAECPLEELVFVQALEDAHFGEVEIYRSQAGLFVMKATRTAISGERRQQEQLQLMEELQGVAGVIPVIHLRRTEGTSHPTQRKAFASSTNGWRSSPSTTTSPLPTSSPPSEN
jgi:hypothetical protein